MLAAARAAGGSETMCPSGLTTGRVPQPASANTSVSPDARAVNRMQEYFVSVCFMEGTAPSILYSGFAPETQSETPSLRLVPDKENRGARSAALGPARILPDTLERAHVRAELLEVFGQRFHRRKGLAALLEAAEQDAEAAGVRAYPE